MKKIVIICNFHKNSGFGHFTRMISLSKKFDKKLFDVIFLFELKNKKFIQSYGKGLNCKYLPFSLEKYSVQIVKYLFQNLVEIVIFDSYHIDLKLEKELYKNFFLVSFDDKILKHNSHMVFNSREDLHSSELSKSGQKWFTGKKFILMNKIKKSLRKDLTIKKILIHAGGSSAYKLLDNFFVNSIKYLSNQSVIVDILYTNKSSYYKLKKKINYLIGSNSNFRLLKFNHNFSKTLFNYDIISGPAGTTTYEAMSSGVLNFSFPIIDDERDSMLSWNLLGNITHLNFKEKNDKNIIKSMWNYFFSNYRELNLYAKKNSDFINDNSKLISSLIERYYKKKYLLFKNLKEIKDNFEIKKARLIYARSFLTSRNSLSLRKFSNKPSHVVTLPEHLNWWKDSKIEKFVLIKNKNLPSAYHWVKLLDVDKKIIISEWFLHFKEKDRLKASFLVINYQKEFLRSYYKGYNWFVSIHKDNVLSTRINKSIGFKKVSLKPSDDVYKAFQFDKKKFNVYKMKI